MKNVSMKIGFAAVFAAAVLAGCSGKKTAAKLILIDTFFIFTPIKTFANL